MSKRRLNLIYSVIETHTHTHTQHSSSHSHTMAKTYNMNKISCYRKIILYGFTSSHHSTLLWNQEREKERVRVNEIVKGNLSV